MRKGFLVPLAGLIALTGLCSFCLWNMRERPRFDHTFDIGQGRTVRVWTIRHVDWDVSEVMVHYRIDRDGEELAQATCMDRDDGAEHRFKVLVAEGGRLACVYETLRRFDNCYMTILYDADSGESWPGDSGNWRSRPEIKKKWRERFERVKLEYPDYQIPSSLLK